MNRNLQPALTLFALGMIGLGVVALVVGDFAMVWQPVAPWVPGRTALAYAAGVLMLVCGAGLLFEATAKAAIRVLFPYVVVWMLLKVPALLLVKVTVPVGVVAAAPDVSLTVAVHVVDIPCWIVLGAQLTLVEDERIVAVTVVVPLLVECVLSPL